MIMIDWFKFSFLLLYLILVVTLVAFIALSNPVRNFLAKIHASPSDNNSWLRYALSIILLTGLGIAIYQATYADTISSVVPVLIGIAITGKVTASSINKNK